MGRDRDPFIAMPVVLGILAHMQNWVTLSLGLEPVNQVSESPARGSSMLRTRCASVLLVPVVEVLSLQTMGVVLNNCLNILCGFESYLTCLGLKIIFCVTCE